MGRPPKKISDFDVRLGRVVKSKRVKADHTRASLADATGIPESNIKRREEGTNEITVSELERIAVAVDVTAAEIVEEALTDYGGMEKLLREYATSEGAATVDTDAPHYAGHVQAEYDTAADENERK